MYAGIMLLSDSNAQLLTLGGVELANTRRYVDLVGCEAARVQFNASSGISVRVEYSLDAGSNWSTLVSEDTYNGSNPYTSGWQAIADDAKANDVLLRGLGIGSGILTTVNYAQLEFR